MSFTLCSSGAIVARAGSGADPSAAASSVLLEQWSNEAEGEIEIETKRTWVSNFGSQTNGMQNMLASTCAGLAAMRLVAHDPSGYAGGEAELIMDFLKDTTGRTLNTIEKFSKKTQSTP